MSNGVYGTTIPSNIDSSMVDIFYSYSETRNSDNTENAVFKKLPSSILVKSLYEKEENSIDNIIEGLYNLKLPIRYFYRKGFYTVYIKPREIPTVILDVASLTAYPNIRGIVLDTASLNGNNISNVSNNDLVGYRVVYFDDDGQRLNYYRIVTSNNKCEPVAQAPNSSSDKAYTYRYDESSTLTFLTLTPSTAPSFKPSSDPFIGNVNQKIALVNTLFEPIMLDIELTEHDADTISTMLEGSQLRNLENGTVTTFNNDNEIYHQSQHFTLKDQYTARPIYEVKENKVDNIDFSQTLEDKI